MGLVVSMLLLTVTSFVLDFVDWLVRLQVRVIERCVFGVVIEQDNIRIHEQRVHNEPTYLTHDNDVINVDQSLHNSLFNNTYFSPHQLVDKTKTFLSKDVMFGTKRPEVLAEDFQFLFPVVGPLTKEVRNRCMIHFQGS